MGINQKILIRLVVLFLLGAVLTFSPERRDLTALYDSLQDVQQTKNYHLGAQTLASLALKQPWREGLWEKSGKFALAAGDRQQAKYAFEQAASRDDLSVEGRYALGQIYYREGSFDLAERTWFRLDHYPPASAALAELYTQQGNFLGGITAWEHYLQLQEGEVSQEVLEEYGILLASHEPLRALPYLKTAGKNSPAAKKLVQALTGVEDEERAYVLLTSGQTLGAIGRWRLAEFAIRQAVELRPDYAEAWVYWAEILQHLDQPETDPASALERARSLTPESPLVQMFYGLYWQRQDEHQKALESFRLAQQSWPEKPEVYIEQGISLAVLGDLPAAEEMYFQALELQPDRAAPYRLLANFYLEYHYRVREAGLPAARKAVNLGDEDPENLLTLGRVLLELGDEANAQKFFYRALELQPRFALAHLHLGLYYLEQGEQDSAVYHLHQAVITADQPALSDQAEKILDTLVE
ncbi:MAG: tetratricopeptide repeat protein [Anaerolineales bacterium]|nr:tetratricopeptide repeat protein [Anaerolineales bacterium]